MKALLLLLCFVLVAGITPLVSGITLVTALESESDEGDGSPESSEGEGQENPPPVPAPGEPSTPTAPPANAIPANPSGPSQTPGAAGGTLPQQGYVTYIAAFDELDESTLWQGYDLGEISSQEDLELPNTLTGRDTCGNPVTIVGVTWKIADDALGFPGTPFDPAVSANYEFSPKLPEGFELAAGAETPTISVFIRPDGSRGITPLAAHVWNGEGSLLAVADGDTVTIASGAIGTLTIPAGATVAIDGTASVINDLELNINAGATVKWQASLTMTGPSTLFLSGTGTFEMTGGLVSSAGSYALWINTAPTKVLINGGAVTSTSGYGAILLSSGESQEIAVSAGTVSTTSGIAIEATYSTPLALMISGGLVSSQTHSAIYAGNAGSTVTVSGGTVTTLDSVNPVIYMVGAPADAGFVNVVVNGTGYVFTDADNSAIFTSGSVSVAGSAEVRANSSVTINARGAGSSVAVSGGTVSTISGRAISTFDASSSVAVSGGTVEAMGAGGFAIFCSGVAVTVSGTGVVSAAQASSTAIRANNPCLVTICDAGEVRATGADSIGIQSDYSIVVKDSATVSATTGRAIYTSVNNSSTVSISGGTVSATTGDAIYALQAGCALTVSGGTVEATGSGNAVHLNGSNDTVLISGGRVCAREGYALLTHTTAYSNLTINGGLLFAYGTRIAGFSDTVLWTAQLGGTFPDAAGAGLIVAWDQGVGTTTYNGGASTDLVVNPATGATAVWAFSGGAHGISYANGANTGFLPVGGVTVLTSGDLDLSVDNSSSSGINWHCDATGANYTITGDVTIIGTKTGAASGITLDIPAGATATWSATLEISGSADAVTLPGNGTLAVQSGEIAADSGHAVFATGTSSTVVVNGGAVSSSTVSAIRCTGAGNTIMVSGGLVTSAGTTSANAAILMTDTSTGTSATVSNNGSVEGAGGAIRTNGGQVAVSGNGSVKATGIAIYTASGQVTVSGNGSVAASGAGETIRTTSGSITVSGSAGVVSTGTGITIRTDDGQVTVSESGSVQSERRAINFNGAGNVLIEGDARVSTSSSAERAIDLYGGSATILGGTVSAAGGGVIGADNVSGAANSTVTVSGGTVRNNAVNNAAINMPLPPAGSGTVNVTISGTGRVENTGSGRCITSSGSVLVEDSAVVMNSSTTNAAIFSGSGTSTTVRGGLVFSYGTGINGTANVISVGFMDAGTPTVIAPGVVIAWNQTAGAALTPAHTYELRTENHILTAPASVDAQWGNHVTSGGGISYANGTNTGFIPLPVVVTKASGLMATDPAPISIANSVTTAQTFDLNSIVLSATDHGVRSYTLGAFTDVAGAGVLASAPTLSGTNNATLTYQGAGAVTGTATQVINIITEEYQDITATITFEAIDTIPLSITGITANNKTYDGTATGSYSGTAALVTTNVLAGDTVSLSGTPVVTFASAGVGTAKTVTITGLSLSGADAYKYVLDLAGYTADISTRALTITGVSAVGRAYDPGNTSVSLTGGTLQNVVAGDAVTPVVPATGTIATADVGVNKAVTLAAITLTGADAANYTLTQPAGITVNITQAIPAALTWPSAGAITYGEALSASSLTGGSTTGSWAWAAPATIPIVANSGYSIIFTPTDTINYDWSGVQLTREVSISVTRATLTGVPQIYQVAESHAFDYSFDLTTLLPSGMNTAGVSYAPLISSNAAGLLGALTYISGSTLTLPVQSVAGVGTTATITVAVPSANYHDFYVDITVTTIAKTPVTITAQMNSGTYHGGSHSYSNAVVTENMSGNPVSGVILVALYESTDGAGYSSPAAPVSAGAYQLTLSVPATHPTHSGSNVFAFTIERATVTIIADNITAVAGSSQPLYTYQISGLATGEVLSVLPVVSSPTANMIVVGTYPIVAAGAVVPSTGNYNAGIIYVNGTLTVNAAPVTPPPVDPVPPTPPTPPADPVPPTPPADSAAPTPNTSLGLTSSTAGSTPTEGSSSEAATSSATSSSNNTSVTQGEGAGSSGAIENPATPLVSSNNDSANSFAAFPWWILALITAAAAGGILALVFWKRSKATR
ncbi:MAG: YDG domain-containing protein [Coriobacteriia bacterium]|nr:YDG domain-containing protein [Coriobacteriia bacterium]